MRTLRPLIASSRTRLPSLASQKTFFSTSSALLTQNRIFNSCRTPDEFHTLNLLSASSNVPLITFWTASWCSNCAAVKPLLKQLIEEEGVGQAEGGLGYTEVELDSVKIGDLPLKYMITSMPTLLAFSRQEPQMETKITRPEQIRNKDFLRQWLMSEAKRRGKGGAGGSLFGGWFGGR